MNIRPLKNADFLTIVNMLKKIGNTKLSTMFVADSGAAKNAKKDDAFYVQMGMLLLNELYDNVIEDFTTWIADLVGKTRTEYLELPISSTMDIIEFLVENEDNKDFFLRALQLYKKISKSKNGNKKE